MQSEKPAKMTRDVLFKKSMLDIAIAKDFFRVYLPQALLDYIDLETLESTSTEQVTAMHRRYIADSTHRVKFKTAIDPEGYFLLLTEQESKHNKNMTVRLFELTAAIVRRALKALPNTKGKRTRLPTIITLVVSTSPTPYPYNLDFHDYFSPHGREFTANATSILIDLACLSEDDLQQQGPIALLSYMFKQHEPQTMQDFTTAFAEFIRGWVAVSDASVAWSGAGDHLWDLLEFMITNQLLQPSPSDDEIRNSMATLSGSLPNSTAIGEHFMTLHGHFEQIGLERGIKQGIAQGEEQGLERGIKQGEEQGLKRVAIRLIKGGLSFDQIAEFTDLSNDMILKLKQQITEEKAHC